MATKVAVGTLRQGYAYWPFIDSLDTAMGFLDEKGIPSLKIFVFATYLHEGRESIANMLFTKPECEDASHLLFVDSDMVLPPNAIWTLLQHDLPIVSGLYFKRVGPPEAVVFDCDGESAISKSIEVLQWLEDNDVPITPQAQTFNYPNSLMACDVAGCGCLLIKREVIEAIPKPRFGIHGMNFGEDVVFCLKAKEAGFQPYVDLNVQCGHITTAAITQAYFRQWRWRKPDDDTNH